MKGKLFAFRPRWVVFGLFVQTICATSTACGQGTGPQAVSEIAHQAPGEVVAVVFQGNNSLSSPELTTVVSTKATGSLSRILYKIPLIGKTIGSPYQTLDYSTVEHDTAVLNAYYRDHGFLSARSNFRIGISADDVKAFNDYIKKKKLYKGPPSSATDDAPILHDTVIYIINEGPPYTIARVAFEGLETLPNEFQPELTERNTIKSGTRWSRAVAATEVERLDSLMIESGYPQFRYDTIVVENTMGTTTVNVLLYFTTGHRYRYGPIEVVYDSNSEEKHRVADRVVKAQLITQQGNWYKLSEIQRSEANLYKLQAFDIARVTLDTNYINHLPDSARDSAEIPVQVFLRPRHRAEVGLGPFAGTGTVGFIAGMTANYQNRNLTGGADNINIQISYQIVPSSQTRNSASIDYTIPYIGLGRVPLILGFSYARIAQAATTDTAVHPYDQLSTAFNVGSNIVLSKLDNRTTLTPGFAIEYINSTTGYKPLQDQLPRNQVNLLPSLTYQDDRSNDVLNPTSGHIFSLSTEYGIPATILGASTAAYAKVVPQYRQYLDLSGKGTMVAAGRLLFGLSKLFYPDDSLRAPSLNRRFYGGGSTTLRGWRERSLIVSEDPTRDPNIGGYNTALANFEIRYAPFQYASEWTSWQKFSSPIRTVLFFDVGNVWDNSLWTDPAARSKFALNTGLGLRYNLFFGSLRLDWGVKLYDPSGRFDGSSSAILPSDQGAWIWSKKPRFGFNVYNFNFALGQAF